MKRKILDVMIDFETFGLQPNSVPINMAVVAWNRYAKENPFVIPGVSQKGECTRGGDDLPIIYGMPQNAAMLYHSRFVIFHFDVCDCLLDGMTIEPETQKWWVSQESDVKVAIRVSGRKQDSPFTVIGKFDYWLTELQEETGADEICIWSQGSDFDIAKLRWLIDRYPRALSDKARSILIHTSFRDARSIILELGNILYGGNRGFAEDSRKDVKNIVGLPNFEAELYQFTDIYDRIPTMENWVHLLKQKDGIPVCSDGLMSNYLSYLTTAGSDHNSIYDCMCSIYNVWWLNKAIDTQMI